MQQAERIAQSAAAETEHRWREAQAAKEKADRLRKEVGEDP